MQNETINAANERQDSTNVAKRIFHFVLAMVLVFSYTIVNVSFRYSVLPEGRINTDDIFAFFDLTHSWPFE